MKKSTFSYTAVFIILLGFITGCQKEIKKPDIDNEYKSASVKQWYYGTFKKSTEFSSYDQLQYGKKLPDWKNGVYKKYGNYEAIDFPLVKQKTFIPFSENDGLSEIDKKRIAASSIFRITFLRDKKGRTEVRETVFIPDIDYLTRSGFDISNNKFGDVDKDFSGMILIKKWDNTNITRSIIRNGKVVQRYTGQPLLANRMSCNGTLVTEYFRDCEVHIYGDGMVTEECGPWMPTGNQWCYDEDPVANPCEDPGSPQCACQEYGLCEGGGGNSEECTQESAETHLSEILSTIDLTAQTEQNTTLASTSTFNSKTYSWRICKLGNSSSIKFVSRESGQNSFSDHAWRWTSFNHDQITKVGSANPFWDVNCALNSATPTIDNVRIPTSPIDAANISIMESMFGSKAKMTLNFTLTVNYLCNPFNPELSTTYTQEKIWTCMD